MKQRSLKFRLLIFSGGLIVFGLIIIGAIIIWSFQSQMLERTKQDLGYQLNQLAALVKIDATNQVVLDGDMTDPRYDLPLSGLYWQINKDYLPSVRSRSLWDTKLPGLELKPGNDKQFSRLVKTSNGPLIVLSRFVFLNNPKSAGSKKPYQLIIAVSTKQLDTARWQLLKLLVTSLTVSAGALILIVWLQVHFGLLPLASISKMLKDIRKGRLKSLPTTKLPAEVSPLVEEINNLISSQHQAIEKAVHVSGNLAHGLKTPLAAISAICYKINSPEHVKDIDAISHYVGEMHLHVERQLAIARSQAEAVSIDGYSNVADEVKSVINTLNKLNDGKNTTWNMEIDNNLSINIHRNDFAEIMGNLLDNARKWAVSNVNIAAIATDTHYRIYVSDNGPGVKRTDHHRILERGIRLDERTPGTGLGLSICQAILITYQSSLELGKSETGGFAISFQVSKFDIG